MGGIIPPGENELKSEKVSAKDCNGFYTCKIIKNKKHHFSVYFYLKLTSKLSLIPFVKALR